MTRLEWFDADKVLVSGYTANETAVDGQQTDAPLNIQVEGHCGNGAMFQGTKSELLRFATDIIEATLIAEARTKDRAARIAALADAETRVAELAAQPARVTLTPEQAAAFKAGQAGWDLAGATDVEAGARLRQEGLSYDGRYTMAELHAMPMGEYLDVLAGRKHHRRGAPE